MKIIKNVAQHLDDTRRTKMQAVIADSQAKGADAQAKRSKMVAAVTKDPLQKRESTQLDKNAKISAKYAKAAKIEALRTKSKDPRQIRMTQQ